MMHVPVAVKPRPYDVLIESGLLKRTGLILRETLPEIGKLFIVTVEPVRSRWGKTLLTSLADAGLVAQLIEMRDGEINKKLSSIQDLAQKLAKLGAERNSALIAFGGGVVGDVTGLLASLYMRGIDVVHIPTTVVAQVDASIGGKTGVNLPAGKNLLGTFHQPRAVLVDPMLLSSLPERQFRSGLYEALKSGVIGNADLFAQFENNKDKVLKRDPKVLELILAESIKLKASIVAADERESGLRRVLNFGHTIGHALEAETKYRKLLHGEAVAWGMVAATNISLMTRRMDSVVAGRITDAVLGLGKLPQVSVRGTNILKGLRADKKTLDGVVHFILPVEIGKVEVVNDVPEKAILAAVAEIGRLSKP
jgi:3-dehydroquinate synthase